MFTTPYKHDRLRSSIFATINREESMTQKSDANETDINVIMQRFGVTGQMPQVQMEPMFADFSTAGDFREAQEMLNKAREAFAEVPAAIRKQFDHDPAQFIEFAINPANKDKLKEWGLTKPEKKPETTLTDVANEIGKLREAFKPTENTNGKT